MRLISYKTKKLNKPYFVASLAHAMLAFIGVRSKGNRHDAMVFRNKNEEKRE